MKRRTTVWRKPRARRKSVSRRRPPAATAPDVTEREATVSLSERRLQAIINAEPACVKLVSLDGFQGTETILLVEDDDKVRAYAATVLKNAGYDVMQASRPATALKMAERTVTTIHLLLSDLIMPGFDGVELTKRFRVSHPHTPVLFMSGYSDEIMARHGLTGDQYELLLKPFSRNNLLQKVREVLSAPAN